jgi:hypothetical protein
MAIRPAGLGDGSSGFGIAAALGRVAVQHR